MDNVTTVVRGELLVCGTVPEEVQVDDITLSVGERGVSQGVDRRLRPALGESIPNVSWLWTFLSVTVVSSIVEDLVLFMSV